MSKVFGSSPSMPQPKGSSSPQNTAVGSGSRPGNDKMTTPTSAPTEPHTLGRAPAGWLR